jgi:glycosyltransferase involved in cell wall biosynthesis
MSWSAKTGRFTGEFINLSVNTITTPVPPRPLNNWTGSTTRLEIETLLSSRQKIAYIKRNLKTGLFYKHSRLQKQPLTDETVSIVMTASNRSKQTYHTLRTISRDSYKNVQVILVDDSTTDPVSIDTLKGYPFTIDFIQILPEKKIWGNPCINYNIGFQFIEGGKVIIQNAEVCHVGNVIDYVHASVNDNSYAIFDVKSTEGLQYNDIVYSKPSIGIEIFSDKRVFVGDTWYQSVIHRNSRYHFLAATTRTTFNKIGGFSYDYTIGNAYDDNDFILRIDSLGIPTTSLSHTDVKCGGIHLYHTPSELGWGAKLPLNDLVFEEKKKHYDTTGEYKDLIQI